MLRPSTEVGGAEPDRPLDLATALGVGIEEAAEDGDIPTVAVCGSPAERAAYRAFLGGHGRMGRCASEAHPQAVAFLVRRRGQGIAAAGLLPDSRLGLPLSAGFATAVDGMRRNGRQIALLAPLVVPSGLSARISGLVLRTLFRLAVLAARRLDGRTDLLVRCEPRYARFFAQVLLFTAIAEVPADATGPGEVLLRLDLDLCPAEWLRLYGQGPWSPFSLYAEPTPQSRRVLEWLRRQRRPPEPDEIIAGWIAPAAGSAPLDTDTLRILQRLHPGLAERMAGRSGPGIRVPPPEAGVLRISRAGRRRTAEALTRTTSR